ncbi:MAG: hypothetical protein AAGA56_21800 [Myxococcota bacterium]
MSLFLIVLSILSTIALLVGVLSALAPTRVAYTESVDVRAGPRDIFDDIRIQQRLMRWSAWPKETRSKCAVDPGPTGKDGEEGSRCVFLSNGKEIGHQRITKMVDQREVALSLEGPGPPHRPSLKFELEPLDDTTTRVKLHFVNELPRPFNAIWHFGGLTKWTRKMHRADLDGLKAFSEPPHRDIDGRVVGRQPELENPYEVALPGAGRKAMTVAIASP